MSILPKPLWIAAILACCMGAASAPRLTPSDVAPYVRPQRMVDAGGHKLNVYCTGHGSPTVILDAGEGGTIWDWRKVQPQIARFTHVCSYDRAGMGFSQGGPLPRDANAMVTDLHALVNNAGIAPPYVLVAHSIAGLYAPLYADRYPQDVAGMVLVDPSYPNQTAELDAASPTLKRMESAGPSAYQFCYQAAVHGRLSLAQGAQKYAMCGFPAHAAAMLKAQCAKNGPAFCELQRAQIAQIRRPVFWLDIASEDASGNEPDSAEDLRARHSFGAMPLIVLTAANDSGPAPFPPAELKAIERVWTAGHDRLARLSSVGVNFVVHHSQHYIQLDRPAVVTSAVSEVVSQARKNAVASAGSAAMSPDDIRATFAAYLKAHPYAMIAAGVIDHGHTATYLVRGRQSKAPLNDRTQFQIGSITKLFTATILAQMVDAGQMNLNDSIQRYLPAGVTAPTYQGRPITLLDLATHESGLPGDPPNISVQNAQSYSAKMLDDALARTQLTRAPGSKWSYSNFGFGVLGQILADEAHLSYDHLIRQRILDPLGMNDTVVIGSAATRQRMAPAYEYGGAPARPQSEGALDPAGSIESDLRDMMTFLRANLEAPQGVLGPELAFAQQPRVRVPEWNMEMGLAWQTVLAPTHHISGDLGDLPAGWLEKGGNTDGFSSFIGLNRASDSGFVALTNVNDDDFQQVIAHAVSPATAKMPVLWATIRRELSPFSGTYVIATGRRMRVDIFKYQGALYAWLPAATTPSKLTPAGKDRYSWDALQVMLTFKRDAGGRVTGFTAVQGRRTMQAARIHS